MRHRKLLLACLVAVAPLLACACSTSSPAPAKPDAAVYPAGNFGAPCTKPDDCTGGGWCDYPTTGGCGAVGVCAAAVVRGVTCVAVAACPCDGGLLTYEGCGNGFPVTGLMDCAGSSSDGSAPPPPEDGGDAGDASNEADADGGDSGDAGSEEDADASDASDGAPSDAGADH